MNISTENIIQKLDSLLLEKCSDFSDVKTEFETACESLKKQIGEEKVESLTDAFSERVRAAVLFAAGSGFEANRQHFRDPFKPTVLDVDPGCYLQEWVLNRMPHYREAQRRVCLFSEDLPDEEHTAVLSYYNYLEVYGQRLAHFGGFRLGDELLPFTEPGYVADQWLTISYRDAIQEWLGAAI